MSVEQGSPLILMGRTGSVGMEATNLSQDELVLFNTEYDFLVARLADVDPQVAAGFARSKAAYAWAISQAKNAFGNIAYSGLRPTSGTFGIRLFTPQDSGTSFSFSASPNTSDVHTWRQSIVISASTSNKQLFPLTGTNVTPSTTAGAQSIHAFHSFISYVPGTRIIHFQVTSNTIPYTYWSVDPYAKLQKPLKPFRLLPFMLDARPSGGVFYTGQSGTWSVKAVFDVSDIAYATGQTIIEEVGVLGLCIAQFTYLNSQLN